MRIILTFLLLYISIFANAQIITWDGGAGTINWEDPLNWTGDVLPCDYCNVEIDGYDVKISTNQTVKGITFTGANKIFIIGSLAHLTVTNSYGPNTTSFKLIEEAQLSVEGTLEITNCTNGLVSAKGIIKLPSSTSTLIVSNIANNAIESKNEFVNHSGYINITDAGNFSIDNYGLFENQSLIEIKGVAASSGSIKNNPSGSVINKAQIVADNIERIENRGVLTNTGSFSLLNVAFGIDHRNGGKFHNYGLIEISNNIGSDYNGLSMASDFVNYSGGIINIDNTELGIFVSDTLINSGIINISNASFAGIEVDEAAFIANLKDIKINNADRGILVQGLGIGQISNGTNGLIDVQNSNSIGISSAHSILNNGKIEVGYAGVFGIECHEGSSIEQGSCGQIINKSGIKLYANSSVQNNGVIQNTGSVGIGTNATINNVGVFVDYSSSISALDNFDNMGILFQPLKGEISPGVKEMNLVSRTGTNTYFVSTNWWLDKAQTAVAGQFGFSDNSFLPNSNAINADSLFLDVTNFICTRSITLPIYKVPACMNNETYTFTQATSTDWHNPANWDTGQVPDYCTIAIIPNTKKCTITTGRKARAFRILSDTGSVFDAELGVLLEVEN